MLPLLFFLWTGPAPDSAGPACIGPLVGVGVQVQGRKTRRNGVRIFRVIPQADPEVRKALHRGDEILAVDGQPNGIRTVDMITREIRGPVGTTVKLRVRLRATHRIEEFSFRRKAFE